MSGLHTLFRRKSIDQLISDCEGAELRLKKSLGWLSLTSLGIGAVIGSGIFTIVGTAIAGQKFQTSSILNAPLLEYLIHHSASFGRPGAGPAIALSFVLVAIVCGFASVCYAELAAMIPIAGSAYTYTYATMGELIAWIIGWDLILEYAVSNMAVSVGFSAHMVDLLDWFGVHPRSAMDFARLSSQRPFRSCRQHALRPRLALRLQLAGFHHRDAADRDSGARHPRIRRDQQHHGVAEDRRDSGVHYFRVALHSSRQLASLSLPMAGPASSPAARSFSSPTSDSIPSPPPPKNARIRSATFRSASSPRWSSARFSISAWSSCSPDWFAGTRCVDDAAPVVNTLKKLHFSSVRLVVLIGALMGMISSLLVFQLGQARVWFAMSRDGLFPKIFSRVHRRYLTPDFSTWVAGFVVGIPAGLLDIGTLADLSNIGTLFAFALVAAGVLILRYREPDRQRAFRAPGGPIAPILTILTCLLLMAGLADHELDSFLCMAGHRTCDLLHL